ncbi:hypothetical protein ACEPAF_9678 [Sanghuangporus sanghuang]
MSAVDDHDKSSHGEVTIIRIKRKRSEDVPDMLVVDNNDNNDGKGAKRRRPARSVFQFAESIGEDEWRKMKQDELRNLISALSRSPSKAANLVPKREVPSSPISTKRQRSNTQNDPSVRKYRVIAHGTQPERRPSRFYPMPPKVRSTKDVEKPSKSGIKIYDAELALSEAPQEVDPEMEKFQQLLQDYLKVHEDIPQFTPENPNTPRAGVPPSTSGDYVYDIFYYRPATLLERMNMTNAATISGLPSDFDMEDEFESDSEIEDEADEDSNAEDYYKNDYPDEESSDASSKASDFWSEDEYDDVRGRFQPDY